ncbi:MAG: dipeptidase [Acidobacteriota bacterium]
MKIKFAAILFILFVSQIFAQTMPKDTDPKLWQKALEIHKKAIIVDGHNDITTPMFDDDFGLATDSRGKFHIEGTPYHTDLMRFKQSGITGEFFSIYVDKEFVEKGGAARRALDLIDTVYREVEKHPDQLMLCTTSADIYRAKKDGKVCAYMGIEGGHAIEDSLFALRDFYRLGVRYMTLTHNNTNNWADACCDTRDGKPYKPYGGLNDFGKEVVKEMNRLGMLVDISHVSDDTMRDVLEISTAPVIYSHSSARVFSDHPRDVPDDILKLTAKNGGVVMVNFYPAFLDQRTLDEDRGRDKKLESQVNELKEKHKTDEAAFNVAKRELYDKNPIYLPSYTKIVDHIDHIRDVAGIDYIGIGSDFDGVPSLPAGMNGAEDLPLITYEMLKRGYSEKDILKVLGGNFMRVFEKAEQAAKTNSRQISGEGSLKKIK